MHAEGRIEADVFGVVAQQAVADRMERAGPGQALRELRGLAAELVVERFAHDFVRAALHLDGGTTREREHENARRIDAAHGEVRDAMRERVGLAGARTGDDQQRAGAETFSAGNSFAVVTALRCGALRVPSFSAVDIDTTIYESRVKTGPDRRRAVTAVTQACAGM